MTNDRASAVRLATLLAAFGAGWQSRDALLVAAYGALTPATDRLFRRDVAVLRVLGFVIERRNTRPPAYRLVEWVQPVSVPR